MVVFPVSSAYLATVQTIVVESSPTLDIEERFLILGAVGRSKVTFNPFGTNIIIIASVVHVVYDSTCMTMTWGCSLCLLAKVACCSNWNLKSKLYHHFPECYATGLYYIIIMKACFPERYAMPVYTYQSRYFHSVPFHLLKLIIKKFTVHRLILVRTIKLCNKSPKPEGSYKTDHTMEYYVMHTIYNVH